MHSIPAINLHFWLSTIGVVVSDQHCIEHGCDPDYVKLTAAKP